MMLRLMEEVGELAKEINHQYGEKPPKPGEEDNHIDEEIGDLIFAIICMANSLNIDLEDSFIKTMEKYTKRDKGRHHSI